MDSKWIPKGFQKDSKRIPKGFQKDFKRIPRDSKGILKDSKGFKNIPKNSNCSSADQKIPKDSERF